MPDREHKLERLLDACHRLVGERDPEAVLRRLLEAAQEVTGARYVAVGVINEARTGLERFLTLGIDEEQSALIGELPRGRGVLGELIRDARPLRLRRVGDHPQSYGFPRGHPPMQSFLGVPIEIRGEVWGNLYLTDKQGARAFTDEDEDALVTLAAIAGTAIDNARVYSQSEERQRALEQAVQGLEASLDIADALGGDSDVDRVLELIVKRGRALVDARHAVILLAEGSEMVVVASAGRVKDLRGARFPIADTVSGQVMRRGRSERLTEIPAIVRQSRQTLGIGDASTALFVPIRHRGEGIGAIGAFDRGLAALPFTDADERLLRTFAVSAGNAIAASRSVESELLRSAITSADAERARWARELHDQTLQGLAALRVALSAAARRDDLDVYGRVARQAIGDIETEISNLRGIVADLRPSLLDDVGLADAIAALLERRRGDGLEIDFDCMLDDLKGADGRAVRELETTVYRIVQESLTNVVKHARAQRVGVSVTADAEEVRVGVVDDGIGFDAGVPASGFGMSGMRERVFMLGGRLDVATGPGGTQVSAVLPLRTAAENVSVLKRATR